jgi:hypothetical protein
MCGNLLSPASGNRISGSKLDPTHDRERANFAPWGGFALMTMTLAAAFTLALGIRAHSQLRNSGMVKRLETVITRQI